MTPPMYTSFVEVVCDVPPLVAAAAYDDIAAEPFVGPGWELRLRAAPDINVRAPGLRASSGLLVAAWPWRAAVAVELDVWSGRRVAVGIRPRGRDVPPLWTSLYFAAAHDAAGSIADRLVAWADQPLRELALCA